METYEQLKTKLSLGYEDYKRIHIMCIVCVTCDTLTLINKTILKEW